MTLFDTVPPKGMYRRKESACVCGVTVYGGGWSVTHDALLHVGWHLIKNTAIRLNSQREYGENAKTRLRHEKLCANY